MRAPTLTIMLSATLLFGSVAQAMPIVQFDKMASGDQDEYVADLVLGAQNVLREAGQTDKAMQVRDLFLVIKAGDQISDGIADFEILLAKGRVADARRKLDDPNARPLEVEDVMALTLRKSNIEVPDSFFTVNSNFRPKLPPKQ